MHTTELHVKMFKNAIKLNNIPHENDQFKPKMITDEEREGGGGGLVGLLMGKGRKVYNTSFRPFPLSPFSSLTNNYIR